MGRIFGLFGGVVAFFLASGATTHFLDIKKNLRDEGSQVSEEPKKQGRLPGNLQRAIDQSNADRDRKFQAIQASVDNQTAISQQMLNSMRGNKILKDSPTVSRRKEPNRRSPKQNVPKGSVETNPFLD